MQWQRIIIRLDDIIWAGDDISRPPKENIGVAKFSRERDSFISHPSCLFPFSRGVSHRHAARLILVHTLSFRVLIKTRYSILLAAKAAPPRYTIREFFSRRSHRCWQTIKRQWRSCSRGCDPLNPTPSSLASGGKKRCLFLQVPCGRDHNASCPHFHLSARVAWSAS